MLADQNSSDEVGRRYYHAAATPDEYSQRGAKLLKQGQVSDAVAAFQQALALGADSAEAHNALGVALRLEGRLDEAIFHCRESVRLAPDSAEPHSNLGSMLEEKGQTEEAISCLKEALRLKPDLANAWSNLGIALYRQRRYGEAAAHYRRAVDLQPDLAEAHNNLASALFDLGQSDEALSSFAAAIRLNPDYREPHWGRALVWLRHGDFERGWPEFEWRPSLLETQRRSQPRWDGSDLAGRTILVDGEQGLGDTLQFVRYGALLRRQRGRVLLVCQPRLVRLLSEGCRAVDQVVAAGDSLPAFDVQVPLLSLPAVFRTTLDSIPADIPYLHPDPELVAGWQAELSRVPGFKIGISWQGNPDHCGDRERSIALTEFEPLAQVPDVQLISLQKGVGREQAALAQQRFPLLDFGERLDDVAGPFMDTAAIMHCLDLVVTCDSAVCHLAGAMGVPSWVALSAVTDWRWLLNRTDNPWYPTLRLFRQTEAGNWSAVFGRIASAVANHIETAGKD